MRRFMIIQYDSAQVAADLLLKRQIVIDDNEITIERPPDRSFQKEYIPMTEAIEVAEILLQAPDEDSSNNILNALNDDCLLEIFQRLPKLDLWSVAGVCKRFNTIAKRRFALKYQEFRFCCPPEYGYKRYTLAQVENCLQKFGSLITLISQNDFENYLDCTTDIVLGMIIEYCNKLDEIIICNISNPLEEFNNISTFFARLKKLVIYNGYKINESKQIYRLIGQYGSNIEELMLDKMKVSSNEDFLHLSQLMNLKKLTLDFGGKPIARLMQAFSSKNVPIEDLVINGEIDDNAIKYISSMKNISVLDITISLSQPMITTDFVQLGQLKNLKKLTLNFMGKPIVHLMQALSSKNVPIEKLDVRNCKIDNNAVKYICQMKNITKLMLNYVSGLVDNHLIEITQHLPNLEEIFIYPSEDSAISKIGIKNMLKTRNKLAELGLRGSIKKIDKATFKEILGTIRSQSNGNKFRLYIPRSILDVSEKWRVYYSYYCLIISI